MLNLFRRGLAAALILIAAAPAIASPGGIAAARQRTPAVNYDTSIGLGVDSAGFTSLPLHSGDNRYFVNASTGSDSNSCTAAKTPSTAKATIAAAYACTTDGQGDQVLIAEGTTYATTLPSIAFKSGGFSLAYPLVFQSYDPADALNAAKYGRATANRPVLTGDWSGAGWAFGGTQQRYIAVRGLDINPGNVSGQKIDMLDVGSGLLFENNILRFTGLYLQIGSKPRAQHWVIRNNAIYGTWSGSCDRCGQGIYADGTDTLTIEDNVLHHLGWKVGASRTDSYTIGGANVYNHALYQQDPTNAVYRRNLVSDGAGDCGNHRGNALIVDNLYLDCPIAIASGGGTGYDGARPTGVDLDLAGNAVLGSSAAPGGAAHLGISSINGRSPSLARYNLFARSANSTNSVYSVAADENQPTFMTFDHNTSYLWNSIGNTQVCGGGCGGAYPGQVTKTFTNNRWDDATSGSNVNIGGLTFASTYTQAGLAAALGFADQAAFITYAINHPEAHIQRLARTQLMAGYGINSPPLQPLAMGMTKFVIGTQDAGFVINTTPGSTLTYSGFPTGFTLSSATRAWDYDGTGSGASSGTGTITETLNGRQRSTSISWTRTVAPILTSASATVTGATTATLSVNTDTANGTLYYIVLSMPERQSEPGWGYVKTGKYSGIAAQASGSQAISSSGTKTFSVTGLTADTAVTGYLMHINAAGNQSIVARTARFTPTAPTWTPTTAGAIHWGAINASNKPYTDAGTTQVSADGDLIAQVNDQSGNARHLAASSTERPTYRTANGGYAEFNGSNSLINATSFAQVDGSGQGWWAARVFVTSTGSWQTALSASNDTSTTVLRLWGAQSGNAAAWSYDDGGGPTGDSAGAVTGGTWVTIFVQVTPTGVEVWKDGTSNGATSLTGTRATALAKIILGRGPFSTDRLTGGIKGWATGPGVAGSTNRGAIETWLSGL